MEIEDFLNIQYEDLHIFSTASVIRKQ